MGLPWKILNQTITRRRPVNTVSLYGELITGAYEDQQIQAQVQQYQRRGTGGENIEAVGIVTKKVFSVYFNTITQKNGVTTDVIPTDRIVLVDGTTTLDCRVEDLHDGAGQRHHWECKCVWEGATGD